jgi:hypothetical protein
VRVPRVRFFADHDNAADKVHIVDPDAKQFAPPCARVRRRADERVDPRLCGGDAYEFEQIADLVKA